jgi:hypothetical protein
MIFKKYLAERDNANHEIRFLRWLVTLMGAVVLVQVIVMARLIGSEKTVLVPPEIKRSFWVSGKVVSKEYLEEMAYLFDCGWLRWGSLRSPQPRMLIVSPMRAEAIQSGLMSNGTP